MIEAHLLNMCVTFDLTELKERCLNKLRSNSSIVTSEYMCSMTSEQGHLQQFKTFQSTDSQRPILAWFYEYHEGG